MTVCDLLVVGAGPVGLTLACEALRHGSSCRVIEQNAEPSVYSKAQVIHSRTMEIFEDMGFARRVADEAREVHGLNVLSDNGRARVAHIAFDGVDSPYPYMLSLSQRETERLLAEHLASLGGRIEWGTKLETFEARDDAVVATVVVPGGTKETLEVPWLAGCDGAHSTVRHGMGLDFVGTKYPQHLIQADVRVELPLSLPPDEVVAFVAAGGLAALIPFREEGRYRMLVPLAEEVTVEPALEAFQQALDDYGPPGSVVSDPRWMAAFNIHARQVDRYRAGRVFLAGDAAHIHSPAGGQGMNMGIQDAYNLAWKLALVSAGRGREALLDSYHGERHPTGAAVLRSTDTATRGLALNLRLRHPVALRVRDHIIRFASSLDMVRRRIPRALSMLEVAYAESPVVGQDHVSLLSANVLPDPAQEHPTLRDWVAFGHGPPPGHRALDAFGRPGEADSPRLFDVFRGTHYTLLLFDGSAPTEEGYRRLEAIGAAVVARFDNIIVPVVVLTTTSRPERLRWSGAVFQDGEGEVHQRYGARAECLYLVRPDGYVAYRSQPTDLDKLMAFIDGQLIDGQLI